MNNDSPIRAIAIVTVTAVVCSVLVTLAAVSLKPIQHAYRDLERNRFIVAISGLRDQTADLPDREIVTLFQSLEPRLVNLDTGAFDDDRDPVTFDSEKAAASPGTSVAIPEEQDAARLGRRSQFVTVYLVRDQSELKRIIFPMVGQGMWSTIYGFVALEPDLNTIAAVTFSEHGETPGIGDQILRPDWQQSWRGRRLYDQSGRLRFSVGGGTDSPSLAALYQADAMTGATITGDAVTSMVRYWFGPHGFKPFIDAYRSRTDR